MTNEECKNILQSIKFILDNDSYSDEVEEALDMAIKALEAEPCEDCISREDAKNEIRRWLGYLDEDMITRINIGIDNLPSVTPSHEDLKEAYINGYDYGVKDWFKAKSQPCEDYISRETLVNELKCGYWNKELQSAKNDPCVIDAMIDWSIRTVKSQPPVTPTRPHREWIDCDQCEHEQDCMIDKSDFCPNCGADIREVQDADSD